MKQQQSSEISDVNGDESVVDQQPTVGQILRKARENMGLTSRDIADSLNLKQAIIDAIEEDRCEQLSSRLFVRGYIRSYAAKVQVSESAVFNGLDSAKLETPSRTIMQSFSRKVDQQNSDRRIYRVSVLIVLVIVVAVIIGWYQQEKPLSAYIPVWQELSAELKGTNKPIELPENEATALSSGTNNNSSLSAQGVLRGAEQVQNSDFKQPQLAPAITALTEPETEVQAWDSNNVESGAEGTPKNGAVVDGAVEVSSSDVIARDTPNTNTPLVTIRLSFNGDCWMELIDGSGEKIAFGVKEQGRVVEIQGQPPLQLVLGAPQFVDVTYQQQPVDLSMYRSGRTARITLPVE